MTNTAFIYLKPYSKFNSVPEMDYHVSLHVKTRQLKQSTREVLHNIAGHALDYIGAAHLKAETIANEIGMSVKSVYRAVKELTELKIVAKENRTKLNGIKGANIYAILPFSDLSNVPSGMSHREKAEKPCESKTESPKLKDQSLILLSTNKSLKDTNITETYAVQNSADKQAVQKEALLAKLPAALNGLTLFFNDSQSIHDLAGVIFSAKDKSVRIEEHEQLFRKTIKSVYEYWQRKVRTGNVEYNVFGLMRKAIKEMCEKIADGSAYEVRPVVPKTPAAVKEIVPQFMIDNETDPTRKAELQAQRNVVLSQKSTSEGLFKYAKLAKNDERIDFEAAQAAFRALLSY